jgi:hypothetical protein
VVVPRFDRPRIAVDFNEMLEQDLVLLAADDNRVDSNGEIVALREGLRVYLYMDDADTHGNPTYLTASGIVERHVETDWSARARWRCRIDEWGELRD